MTIFQMRVTEPCQEKLSDVMLWLRTKTTVLIIAREHGSETEKQHIHALIEMNDSEKSGFIQAFHKHFGNAYKGNKGYSCEAIKKPLNNNLRYLCKGEGHEMYDVPYKGKFTDEEVHQMNDEYWKEYQLTNFSKALKKDSIGKVSKAPWCEKVTKQFEIEHYEVYRSIQLYHSITDKPSSNEQESYQKSREQLFDYCMKSLGKSYKILDETIIKKLFNGVINACIQADDNSSKRFNIKYFKTIDSQFGLM